MPDIINRLTIKYDNWQCKIRFGNNWTEIDIFKVKISGNGAPRPVRFGASKYLVFNITNP